MAQFSAGVAVVTSQWQGMPHALTATAFASVSLTPPLVLVCIGKRSRFHHAVTQAGSWAVSILSAEQVGLARHFGHSGRDLATQFDGVNHDLAPHSGAPILDGALGWLDCITYAEHDAGDHTIVVGRVVATGRESEDSPPLTYHRGTYSCSPEPR
jgi:flavin reductase (DIM6/NTAB) family NADH-FMN oxidoreductase RutF